jgi:CBS domain-containing protein
MRASAEPVREDETLDRVVERMRREGRKELFVVGIDERFLGTITLADLSEHLAHPESLSTIRAGDAVYPGVPVLYRDDRLTEAIGRWAQVSRDRLPVLDGPVSRKLVGELSSGDIFTIYNQEILRKEARLARFVRTGHQDRPETTYVELPEEYVVAMVTLPESFETVTVRALNPRARFGVNVIEIKRTLGHGQSRRLIPDPDTELKAGDGLIVVGRVADIAHLKDPLWMARLLHPDAVAPEAGER